MLKSMHQLDDSTKLEVSTLASSTLLLGIQNDPRNQYTQSKKAKLPIYPR